MSALIKTRLILLNPCWKKCKTRWRNFGNTSYIHNLGNEPLSYMTLGNLVESSATKYRDVPAIISRDQKRTITFGDLLEEADRFAAGLLAAGLQKGDRIGLCLPNRYEWNVIMFACARADLILAALNPAYQAPELEYCINKVGMKAIICGDKFKSQNYYEMLNRICPEVNKSEPGGINSEKIPSLKTVILVTGDTYRGTYNYNEILGLCKQNVIKDIKNSQHLIPPDNASIIQFTSGTTGKPKASISSHFNMINNSYAIAKRTELHKKQHIACLPNPLFHAFGITIATLSAMHFGTTSVFPSMAYNPNKTLDAAKEEKCTILYGTPTMHVDLIDVQARRKEVLHADIALTGGSPCSPQLFRNMLEILKVKKVKSVYGLSETTAVVFHSMEDDDEYHSTATVGRLADHIEAKIIDSEGRAVPFGQTGELCVRGYANFLGYWEDEVKTRETIGADGWLRTGDQFILEKNGYGKIVGRLKDMIIRGGENIFPKEIEDYLNTHPDILETQVIGVAHERLGEEVCAFVRLKKGATLTKSELVEFCKGNISHFKIPSHLKILDEFPKTTSGKIQKFKLKELL